MPIEDKLWCVHVQGPDSLIAQPDEVTARRRADEWNAAIQSIVSKNTYEPAVRCVATQWPYTAAQHAEDLAEHGGEPDDIC